MSLNFLVLLLCNLLINFCFAKERGDFKNAIFLDGKSFNTKNHEKSKGISLRFEYPKNWIAKEGIHPNVVQVFTLANDSTKNFQIMIKDFKNKLPKNSPTYTYNDRKDFFSTSNLKELVPVGYNLLLSTSTTIDGEPSGLLDYSICINKAGKDLCMITTSFMFFDPNANVMILLQCSSGAVSKDISLKLKNEHLKTKELCQKIASTVIFDEKWK